MKPSEKIVSEAIRRLKNHPDYEWWIDDERDMKLLRFIVMGILDELDKKYEEN